MRIRQLGESCLIMKELPCPAAELAHTINSNPPPGLLEAVPAFNQLALYFDPDLTNTETLLSLPGILEENSGEIANPLSTSGEGKGDNSLKNPEDIDQFSPKPEEPVPAKAGRRGRGGADETYSSPTGRSARWGKSDSKTHTIPALYNAPDLIESAQALTITVEQLIQLHSRATYTVEAIGFSPGFPYLSGLPPELQSLPRRTTPRTKVEPGSIAIVGDQCCIYPLERPGGWNLIAKTPLTLVDPETDYFPLQVGDTLQFQQIDQQEYDQMMGQRL